MVSMDFFSFISSIFVHQINIYFSTNSVDKPVNNPSNILQVIHTLHITNKHKVDIHRFIERFSATFPLILTNKRYKLINFADSKRSCG